MKRTFLTTLLIGTLHLAACAQDFDQAKLDQYFDTLEKNNRFMGSVAVSKDGALLYSKSVGFSDVENGKKANENTKYRIGSISKTFTAILVMKAVEENRLDLNQTIEKDFQTIKNASKITVKHLLNHRSGIYNFTNDPGYLSWNTQAKTEKEMVETISAYDSDFEPDTKAAYSNSNFVLLTYLLEKSFRKPYAELIELYITKPAGLHNTYFGGKIDPGKNESKSYRPGSSWEVQSETDMSVPAGAGGVVSTPGDLVKFAHALFNGKLLKPESLATMKAVKDGYGNGLLPTPFHNKNGYGHSGGIDGFTSFFSYFSDGNISYALTSNGANFNANDISIAVLSAVYGKSYNLPVFTEFEVNPEDLDQYLGIYSSGQIPLKITITKENNKLIAQATGQSSFPLESTGKDKFKFDLAGIVMEFTPLEKSMLLKQGGGQFSFKKE